MKHLLAAATGLLVSCCSPVSRTAAQAVSLPYGARAVRSVDPRDQDNGDLAPLRDAVGNARIVVLGEATHGDGATSLAKSRIVRMLHRELGFDVLLFEAGVVGAMAADAAFREGAPAADAARHLMAGGWQTSAYVRPTFEYISEQRGKAAPIAVAGFDSERGPHAPDDLVAATLSLIPRMTGGNANRSDRSLLQRAARVTTRLLGDTNIIIGDETRDSTIRLLRSLEQSLDRCGPRCALPPAHRARARLVLGAFRTNLRLDSLLRRQAFGEWNRVRDSAMATQVRLLADSLYPNRRIIIWAATAHFIARSSTIERAGASGTWAITQAGDYLRRAYRDSLYVLAFTAGGGTAGQVTSANDAGSDTLTSKSGTLEAELYRTGVALAFLDLRPRRGEVFRMLALGRNDDKAIWSEIIDGVFFIREQRPEWHPTG